MTRPSLPLPGAPPPAPSAGRRPLKLRLGMGAALLLLIWILAPLITLPRAKAVILSALQTGLGRRIEAQQVRLHIFPLPGVELDQVGLAEDPAFGLEDMVVADSATANVSLWALLHGHLVFSRIHLQDPSINLVRNGAGHWNITALLQHTAHASAAAPGGNAHAAPARFPYLEWSNARINFKFDQTKARFYLDQVSGSLARERSDWRLQASFVPARSDLNLSDTGEVTVDGRWRIPAASLQQTPFALAVHLHNSYLAGSTALVAGHDAGVHGILNAALRVAGTGQSFAITGTVTAVSLRRWDLLPSPARITASLDAVYTPAEDRLRIVGIGDPGWQHFHLAGTVQGLLAQPRAQLDLQLHDFAAANLLPLALALKAHLPADLAATGTLNGSAQLDWQPAHGLPLGHAAFRLLQFQLSSNGNRLRIPSARLQWNGHRLLLLPADASLRLPPGRTPLRLSASVDASGFALDLDAGAVDGRELAALASLVGVEAPWPAHLGGSAKLALQLAALWPRLEQVQWSGSAAFPSARFQPPGSTGVRLQPLHLQWGASRSSTVPLSVPALTALSAEFSLAGLPVAGRVRWNPRSGADFSLTGERPVPSAAIWALLHPAPGDLMQRMFGSVLGQPAPPAWLENLHAQGTIQLRQLDWHGVRTGLRMQMEVSPGGWRAPSLQLDLGNGLFQGAGGIENGRYLIHGRVAAVRPLSLQAVLESTPYAGLLRGRLSGALTVSRPIQGGGWARTSAEGDFHIRSGSLASASGPWPFQACSGHFQLRQGEARVSQLVCHTRGQLFHGGGEVHFGLRGTPRYTLTLHHAQQVLTLRNPTSR